MARSTDDTYAVNHYDYDAAAATPVGQPSRMGSRHELPGREVTAKVRLAGADIHVVAPEVTVRMRVDGTIAEALAALTGVLRDTSLENVDDQLSVTIGSRTRPATRRW
jgi:hypothetical protein